MFVYRNVSMKSYVGLSRTAYLTITDEPQEQTRAYIIFDHHAAPACLSASDKKFNLRIIKMLDGTKTLQL
jgi:hypothetical protein